jgi:hypothetical protein
MGDQRPVHVQQRNPAKFSLQNTYSSRHRFISILVPDLVRMRRSDSSSWAIIAQKAQPRRRARSIIFCDGKHK